jgi:microcystin-dependent protein
MPRYPEYQIHSLDTYGYGRIIQTIDGKFYDGWGNSVVFTLFGKEVSINVEGVGEDSTDGGNVNVTNTNNTDLFQDLQNQINDLKNKLNQQNTQLSGASYVLPGIIVMWGGSVNGIPTGWALCDGSVLYDESKPLRKQLIDQGNPFGSWSNSPILPDLRERFVVGAGGDNNSVIGSVYNVGDKGGVINNMLTLKNIPEHEHRFIDSWTFNIKYKNVDTPGFSSTQVVDTLDFTSYGSWKTTAFNLGSNRGIWNALPDYKSAKDGPGFTQKTVNNATDWYPNDPTPIENRPPYFALCFIIKL